VWFCVVLGATVCVVESAPVAQPCKIVGYRLLSSTAHEGLFQN
jgi:hypothetical protein